jgi:3-phenylpropionate/trans-cinnamate dioxygenase ferredoxin reductase subunit
VGGGLAAVKAIEQLRELGTSDRITLIGDERQLPYERPVLSKGYLLGNEPRESAFTHDQQWYADQQVEVVLGDPVINIDRTAHSVRTRSENDHHYDKLLLATGSEPRRLPLPGAGSPNVHLLRDLPDAERIDAAIADGRPMVIIGGGWIALEVAAAARERGVEVTLLVRGERPLQSVLGPEVAEVFADMHRQHGVQLITGAGITGLETKDDTVRAVLTADGGRYEAGAVVAGIGVTPRIQLAADAGLETGTGVLTDGSLRTSDPDIYAAGDIAEVDHPSLGRRVRVEHWAWAHDTGPVAARAILGEPAQVEFLPFFFTDQYDLGMEYIGHLPPDSKPQVELRGDVAGREFAAYWLVDGRVAAGMHVNQWDTGIDPIKEIVQSGDPNRI